MCGIFGWDFDGKPCPAQMGALAALLSIGNEERGSHAWGYATGTGIHDIVRGIGTLTASVPASTPARHASIMAHTRYKTHGDICVENSHPFTHGNIVGAHNGMIFNEWSLAEQYGRDYAVDSRHIFEHIKCNLPFSDLEGYGSIEYMDANEPGAIYLCKMLDGELSIVATARGVVWSSDRAHLDQALQVAGIPIISRVKVKEGRVYRVCKGKVIHTSKRLDLSPSVRSDRWSSYSDNIAFAKSIDMKPTAYDARLDEWDDEDHIASDMAYHRFDDASDDMGPITRIADRVHIVEDRTQRTSSKRVYSCAPVKVTLPNAIQATHKTEQLPTKAPAGFMSRLLGRNA